MKILVTGGSSGVGKACVEFLSTHHHVVAPDRDQLDLGHFEQVANYDLSTYDVVINCAGANPGAYLGWQKNSWKNQATQVDVNFTGALLLAKQYTVQRTTGQFVFVTSYNIEDPIAVNIFYTASKAALRYSMQTLRKEVPGIVFTEICPGKIRTNMLKQNYQDAKTSEQIQELYDQSPNLSANEVAQAIAVAVQHRWNHITMVPHDHARI